MNKKKKTIIILGIIVLVMMLVGSTLAFWAWQSSDAQKTNITLALVTKTYCEEHPDDPSCDNIEDIPDDDDVSGFSCSADGGGNITSANLIPTECTDTTYAIKRTVTVSPTLTTASTVYLNLWLNVNSIGSGLSASSNFKYALTTNASSCVTGVVTQGNFNGATTNTKKMLLNALDYSATTTETYYLWIWLDAEETSTDTMNQSFDFSLGGTCADGANTKIVYTLPALEYGNASGSAAFIKSTIPTYVKQYDTVAEVKDIWDFPAYFKTILTDDDTILDNYLVIAISSDDAANNPGLNAGTYYLKGGKTGYYDDENNFICDSKYLVDGVCTSPYYEENVAILNSIFEDSSDYCSSSEEYEDYYCYGDDLSFEFDLLFSGGILFNNDSDECLIDSEGVFACYSDSLLSNEIQTLSGISENANADVYTVNVGDEDDTANTYITVGQAIPNAINTYITPLGVISKINNSYNYWALEFVYVPTDNGLHTIEGQSYFFLAHELNNNLVTKSYVVLVITVEAAELTNNAVVSGTYYFGGTTDDYATNLTVLDDLFNDNKEEYCTIDNANRTYSCVYDNLNIDFDPLTNGITSVSTNNSYGEHCSIYSNGNSYCYLDGNGPR